MTKTSFVIVLLAFALGGCVKVAPYERGMLAHPTMTPEEIAIGLPHLQPRETVVQSQPDREEGIRSTRFACP